MDLIETLSNDLDDDEVEVNHDDLKPSRDLNPLRPAFAKAAQEQYDQWQVIDGDEIGFQDEFAGGGICHLIAEKFSEIMDSAGFVCSTVSSMHEQHVYCVAQCSDGVFEVDLPYRIYETGGGFTWKRIEGVTFEPDDISISRLDVDPGSFDQYTDS